MKSVTMLLTMLLLVCAVAIPFQECASEDSLARGDAQQLLETGNSVLNTNGTIDALTRSITESSMRMVHVSEGGNNSVSVFLGNQTGLEVATIGSSTMINPPLDVENKIDVNLLNLTRLVEEGYIRNNQTNVIISFSNMTSTKEMSNWLVNEGLYDKAQEIYTSKNAWNQMDYVAACVGYSAIFDLAESTQVDHIWLDREFQAYVNQSVPLIENATEWAEIESSYGRSINGTGVKIAILDTGIDSTHPDFSFPNGTSKIVGAVSFVPNESTSDGFGHGTDCAGIAAGTGAASGYQYVGVAPGAMLLNVKVLNNSGEGLESWIISGIQWAVDNKANILSMSFGTLDGDNGSGPLSTTVDWAVSQGAVCVVAAGNSGPETYTVTDPGVAKFAITVGASTQTDTIASFSSQGPTSDYRIKPDVVAPGVDIISARANGTSMGTPISQYYTMASGTSMATAAVAGAAALLLDAHPSWSPMTVKMALANYAKDIGGTVLEQGSGRIDVCKAVNASAVGNSSISFGRVSLNAVYKQVFIIQNIVNRTLNVALNAEAWDINDGTPYNVVSMNTSSLTLSKGATGRVELSLTTSGTLPDGYYEGVVNATFGDQSIRIPFFFCILSQVNVQVTDESGSQLMAAFALIDAQNGTTEAYLSENSSAQFTMFPGDYVVEAVNDYASNPSGSFFDPEVSFILDKEFNIGAGETMSLTLSLASAYELQVRTTDVQGSPLYLVQKQLLTPSNSIGYFGEIGALNSQYLYLTNLSEYIKPPCFFGFAGFAQDDTYWKQTGTLTPEVDPYFIGWDLSKFGLSNIPTALNYTNSQLATFNINTTLSESSAVSTIWFNQIAGMWQGGLWNGYQTNPGILWKAYVLPYQYETSPSANYSELEWSCIYSFSAYPQGAPEYYVIDRHFDPITEGENATYSMGATPLLPQDVVDNPPDVGSGLYIPYYPLRVEENLFVGKTNMQTTKRLEVFRNGYLISNSTYNWEAPIPISQFLNSGGYGLYSFVVQTGTSFNCSTQNTAEYTINYTSASADLIPPSITKIDCPPSFIGNEQPVEVQLADNDKISNVSLLYSTGNGSYVPSQVTNLGNNTFSADLTFPAGAQDISLIIEASDGNGNEIRFETDPATVRGYETTINANVSDATITGKLTVMGGSLVQPVYLKVESDGKTMYTLTDAGGNFEFSVPTSFSSQIQIEMSTMGAYFGSSWITDFLTVQTEPAGVVSISGEGWYAQGTNVVLEAPESIGSSPNTRYEFSYWDVDGTSQVNGVNTLTVSMNANHTATAHYTMQYSSTQPDIAITNVTNLRNFVGQGFLVNINVTVANQGGTAEAFNITIYANSISVARQAYDLSAGSVETVTLTWNTTGFALGNYTISASVTLALGETNNWTGPFTYGTVQITKVGDFGGYPPGSDVPQFGYFDGSCGPDDIPLFIQCYRGTAGQWEYLGDLGGYPPGSDVPQFFYCTGSCGPQDIPLFIRCYRGQGP